MATINIFYKIYGLLTNGSILKAEKVGTPVTITASGDLGGDTTYSVPDSTVFTLTDDLDATTDLVVIISPVNAILEWDDGTSANNSSIGIWANVPFIMARLLTTEYSSTSSTRASNAATNVITTIRIYHEAGSTQKVRVVTFD